MVKYRCYVPVTPLDKNTKEIKNIKIFELFGDEDMYIVRKPIQDPRAWICYFEDEKKRISSRKSVNFFLIWY